MKRCLTILAFLVLVAINSVFVWHEFFEPGRLLWERTFLFEPVDDEIDYARQQIGYGVLNAKHSLPREFCVLKVRLLARKKAKP